MSALPPLAQRTDVTVSYVWMYVSTIYLCPFSSGETQRWILPPRFTNALSPCLFQHVTPPPCQPSYANRLIAGAATHQTGRVRPRFLREMVEDRNIHQPKRGCKFPGGAGKP